MSEVDTKIMSDKRWEFFQDYGHNSLSDLFEDAYRIGHDEGFKKLQAENDLLKDRLKHEVEMIECAAKDEIERLNEQLKDADDLASYYSNWHKLVKNNEGLEAIDTILASDKAIKYQAKYKSTTCEEFNFQKWRLANSRILRNSVLIGIELF